MAEFDFTKHKFLGLPHGQQHKHCAALVRRLYELLLAESPQVEQILEQYNRWLSWMSQGQLEKCTLHILSDTYHAHLQHAHVKWQEHNLLPRIRKGDKKEGKPVWPITVYLDNLRSAHNVGSIFRTMEAFALGKVVCSAKTPDGSHPQVKNTSKGASDWVDWSCGGLLEKLPRPLIALETTEEAIPLHEFIFPNSFTLAVGNEEYGCSEEILQNASCCIEIPLRGRKNSLNVANAFAIAAAEIQRQRERGGA